MLDAAKKEDLLVAFIRVGLDMRAAQVAVGGADAWMVDLRARTVRGVLETVPGSTIASVALAFGLSASAVRRIAATESGRARLPHTAPIR